MNENQSPEWAAFLHTDVLLALADGLDLGREMIEIGPGPGAATDRLRHRVARLVAVECDPRAAQALAAKHTGHNVEIVCGDGAELELDAASFDSAGCFTMLHHLPTVALQNRLLGEVFCGPAQCCSARTVWPATASSASTTATPTTRSSPALRRPAAAHRLPPDQRPGRCDVDLHRPQAGPRIDAMIGRLHQVVIDTRDPALLAAFYSELLGLPVTYTSDEWVVIAMSVKASGIAFQLASDHLPPTWPDPAGPQQFHLDVMVDDVDAAMQQVLVLGARRVRGAVFTDPAGHSFCLIPRPAWAPPVQETTS